MNVISLAGTKNTRYVTKRIVRSDKLDKISENDKETLLSLGVDTIIDLRAKKDRLSSIVDDERFDYHYYTLAVEPWEEIVKTKKDKDINNDDILVEQYWGYLRQYNAVSNILDIIRRKECSCVIMCHYGKDRTGVIAALIGLIVNREFSEIIEDYAISSKNLKETEDDNVFSCLKSNAEIMKELLDRFVAEYGNIDNYLEVVGINMEEKQELIKKIVGE